MKGGWAMEKMKIDYFEMHFIKKFKTSCIEFCNPLYKMFLALCHEAVPPFFDYSSTLHLVALFREAVFYWIFSKNKYSMS